MIKNLVTLSGYVSPRATPYFDVVPSRENKISFLCFHVLVPRSSAADSVYSFRDDSIRVVAYGQLAEKTFPVLEPEEEVEVEGWLQSRKVKATFILEVVATRVMTSGQLLPGSMLKRLRIISTARGVPLRELTTILLEPQLLAVEAAWEGDGGN